MSKFTILFLLPLVRGQLLLISGTPGDYMQAYGSELLEVREGKVNRLSEIFPAVQPTVPGILPPGARNMEWVGVSPEWRKAVVVSRYPTARALVIDLEKSSLAKDCDLVPKKSYFTLSERWLATGTGRGETLDLLVVDNGQIEFIGMNLDTEVPCDLSFSEASPLELAKIFTQGAAGVGYMRYYAGTPVNIGDRGQLVRRLPTLDLDVSFGFTLPPEFQGQITRPFVYVAVNTPETMVLFADSRKFFALRKADNSWRRLSVPLDENVRVRAFGNYLAMIENSSKDSPTPDPKQERPASAVRENPGRAEWRTEAAPTGPSTVAAFEFAGAIYPGRLHILDLSTENLYTIATNQADSEIILIEDGEVYYRVSDRLYKASISEKGVGTAQLLAQDDRIRDAHWAFIRH